MHTFSFNPTINLVEQGKWLLGVTFLKQQTLFLTYLMKTRVLQFQNQVNESQKMLNTLLINEKKLLKLDKRDLCLHIAAVREKRHNIYVGGDEYDLSDLYKSLSRNEIF